MFGVTCLPVLWSPAGAPIAGVPGPRRSADECDAGWFAPVATRRRSMFGGRRRPPSRKLAVPQTAGASHQPLRAFTPPLSKLGLRRTPATEPWVAAAFSFHGCDLGTALGVLIPHP